MFIAIPPKHAAASVVGFLKGKGAMAMARLSGKERNFSGERAARRTAGFERPERLGRRETIAEE